MRLLIAVVSIVLFLILFLKFKMKKLTFLICIIIGISCFLFFNNVSYYSFFTCFFLVGILKSLSMLRNKKSDVKDYNMSNFVYSAGIPFILSILIIILQSFQFPTFILHLINLGIIVSIASLLSDTAGSEIGQIFNFATVNIINLKEVKKGDDGGISLIGTIACLVIPAIFLMIINIVMPMSLSEKIILLLSAFISSIIDSIIGATLQNNRKVTNEQTNLIAISFSTMFCIVLILIIQ